MQYIPQSGIPLFLASPSIASLTSSTVSSMRLGLVEGSGSWVVSIRTERSSPTPRLLWTLGSGKTHAQFPIYSKPTNIFEFDLSMSLPGPGRDVDDESRISDGASVTPGDLLNLFR